MMSAGMSFSIARPLGERYPTRNVPRRKPAPDGIVTATQESFVGSLNGVLDASRSSLAAHQAIPRRPVSRNLIESQPQPPRKQRAEMRSDAGVRTPPAATISHLSTATLTGGAGTDREEAAAKRLLRGKKIVPTPAATTGSAVNAARPGKKIFTTKAQEESGPVSNGPRPLHRKQVEHIHDTPSLLRFSPRKTVRPATAPPAATASRPVARVGAASDTMRGVLTWSGATPRYGRLKTSHNPHVPRPATASSRSAAGYHVSAPFDASFKPPPSAAAAGVSSGGAAARRRGPHRVANRPMTARGLLSWN